MLSFLKIATNETDVETPTTPVLPTEEVVDGNILYRGGYILHFCHRIVGASSDSEKEL